MRAPPEKPEPEPWDDVLGGSEPEPETRVAPTPGRVYRRTRAEAARPHSPPGARRGRGVGVVLFLLAVPVAAWIGYRTRLGPGIASLSPELLDFGAVRAGSASPALEVRVRNQGERPLTIAPPRLDGDAAGDFVVIQDGCTARPLAPATDCPLRLAFAPGGSGPRRGRLVIASDAPNSPQSLPLLGVGVAGALAFEPRDLDLGEQEIGTAGPPRELSLVSSGSAPVRIQQIGFEGVAPGAGDFVLASDGCTGRLLAAGERCALAFELAPTAEGPRSATLRVTTDAGETGVGPRLSGRGVAPRPLVRLEPSALVFAEVEVGTTGPFEDLRVENAGSGLLHLAEVVAEPAGELVVEAGDCAGRTVAPRGSCRIRVAYRPSGEGNDAAVLVLRHDAEPGVHRVPVSAIGTTPRLFADPDRLAFGETALGGEPGRRVLRLVSSGSAPLALVAVEAEGSDATAFEVDAARCLGAARSLPPGEACEVKIAFRPRREGPQRGELAVRSNAAAEPLRVAVNGIGIRAGLAIDRERLDFGDVPTQGQGASRTLTLTSSGRASLAIRRLRLTGPSARDFQLGADRCSGAALPPGQRCAVTVVAKPSGPGVREARLVVESSADQEAGDTADEKRREVALRVNGTVVAAARLEVEPEAVDLGAGGVGERGAIVTVTLSNPGSTRLELGEPEIGGEHPGDFRVVPGSCAGAQLIAAGARCTLGLRFVPGGVGLRHGVLVIPHDAAGGATRVELRGEGLAVAPGGG